MSKKTLEQEDLKRCKAALRKLNQAAKDLNDVTNLLVIASSIRGATASLIGIASKATSAAGDALSIDLENIERNARN